MRSKKVERMAPWKTKDLNRNLFLLVKKSSSITRLILLALAIPLLSQCTSEVVSERIEKGPRNTVYKLVIYSREGGLFADVMETYTQARTLIVKKVIKGNKCTAEPVEWAFLTALTLGLGAFACLDDPNQEITTYTSETNQTPLSGYVPLKNAIIDGEIAFPSDQSLKTKTLLAVEAWPAVKIKLTERPASQRLGLSLRIASTQTDKLLEFNCAVELDSAGTASCYDRDSVKRIEGDDHWYDVRKFF